MRLVTCFSIVLPIVFSLLPALAFGQGNEEIHYLRLNELLIYVLPFYLITVAALGLFLHKLMRPNFSNKWLYICTIIGLLGAAGIAYKFKEIRLTQLPSIVKQYENEDRANMRPETQERIDAQIQAEHNETIANYWIVAIPNFILLGLGLSVDYLQRKEKRQES